jgi:NitT/TauT family transport system permease protein
VAAGRSTVVVAGRVALAAICFAVWYGAAAFGDPRYVAGPVQIVGHLSESIASGRIVPHIAATLWVALLGLTCGASGGIALPVLLALCPRLIGAVEPYLAASASVPKYALMPLLILWFGIDQAPRICLVALLVFYPVCFGVLAGIREFDRRLLVAVRVLGASRAAAMRLVIWPSMLPLLFAALRVAVPRALGAAVIAELLVGDEGIGYLIRAAQQNVDTTGVLAGVAVAVVLVIIMAALVDRLERVSLAWRPHRPAV